jgi:hypothetical protein
MHAPRVAFALEYSGARMEMVSAAGRINICATGTFRTSSALTLRCAAILPLLRSAQSSGRGTHDDGHPALD